jgi:hypothetical protein
MGREVLRVKRVNPINQLVHPPMARSDDARGRQA